MVAGSSRPLFAGDRDENFAVKAEPSSSSHRLNGLVAFKVSHSIEGSVSESLPLLFLFLFFLEFLES